MAKMIVTIQVDLADPTLDDPLEIAEDLLELGFEGHVINAEWEV